ncbi:hypothetical protein TKWG_07995 [Advenella kashmirensis WT001]|uniref:Uncharacterized protein n=1 Tax=Advenella kashmirensis (strain DSM 17095 / LMG 22695 / WT001) TaxID=1036672 RepID=I3UAG5_ADVKW|nr:hypothetical protein TKWG_07995 [Advenella kashmirensis WT001]
MRSNGSILQVYHSIANRTQQTDRAAISSDRQARKKPLAQVAFSICVVKQKNAIGQQKAIRRIIISRNANHA